MPADPAITNHLNELEEKVGAMPDGPVKQHLATALAQARAGHITQTDPATLGTPGGGLKPAAASMGDGLAACC